MTVPFHQVLDPDIYIMYSKTMKIWTVCRPALMLPHHLLMDDSALNEGAQGERSRGHGRQKAPFWAANQELSRRHRLEEEARRLRQVHPSFIPRATFGSQTFTSRQTSVGTGRT